MLLTPEELQQYSQQIKLSEVGITGQVKLKNARVLCIGAGGLGSSSLLYLTAAGIGTIGIIDHDIVAISNLHRQILYQHSHIGLPKALIAKQQLAALNPHIKIVAYPEKLTVKNARELINEYDIVADCSDNFATRYLINDTCFQLDKPYVFASVGQFTGQCAIFFGKQSPCLRCVFPPSADMNQLANCAESGVLGVLPGLLGTMQAAAIIKWLLQLKDHTTSHLLTVNALTMQFRYLQVKKHAECDLCVYQKSTPHFAQENHCITDYAISKQELTHLLANNNNIILVDVRTPAEYAVFHLKSRLLPLAILADQLTELDPQANIVVYCQSGARSIQALKILLNAKFQSVRYLSGGLDRYLID